MAITPTFRAAVLSALLVTSLSPAARAQSPWTLNRSGYAFDNAFVLSSTSEVYDEEGNKVTLPDGGKSSEFSNVSMLEYGVRDRLGFILQVPVRSLKYEDDTTDPSLTNTGFADITLGLRYRVAAGSVVASVQADAIFAPGYYEAFSLPPLGHGRFQGGGQLLLGRSVPTLRGYVQANGGYRVVTGGRADLWLAGAEVGSWVAPRVRLTGSWHWNTNTGDGDLQNDFGGRLSGLYRLSSMVQLEGGADHTVGGQNVDAGTFFFLGVSVRGNTLGKFEGPLSSTLEETPTQ